ncbi:MAG: type IV pilus secretin PilQ [Pseudomonadales bacterium]
MLKTVKDRLVGLLVLGLALLSANAAYAQRVLLQSLEVAPISATQMELKLVFDAPPPVPTAFVLKNPDRVLIDIWGVENNTGKRQFSVKKEALRSVELVQSSERLRLVANLNKLANYTSQVQGNTLVISLDQGAALAPAKVTGLTVSKGKARTRVKGIDFERAENGVGRVKIRLSDDRAGVDVIEEGHNVVVNLTGASLSDSLNQRLDVQDFVTPVMFIDTFSQGLNAGILIKPTAEPFTYKSYQVGDELILDFAAKKQPTNRQREQSVERARNPYTGEKIDLNFQNVGIRSVLQIIAEVAQKNLVVDDTVNGNITLRLQNVPWDQALDIVLKTRGLGKRLVGNVLLVAPAAKIAERERIELEGQQQVEELAPIETEFIQINYRKSSEMKSRLEEASLITKRGFALADDETNVLMVRETAKQLDAIRRTLNKFDIEVAQIMVEAKLLVATNDVAKDLGVRWGVGYESSSVNIGGAGATAAPPLAGSNGEFGLAVDLGVTPQSAIRLGLLSSSGLQLSTEISALNTAGKAEVLSQPKVVTTNGKAAKIESGSEIAFTTVVDGTPTLEYKDVVLSLDVTPQLTPGDQIALELKIKQDSIASVLTNGAATINKNSLETSVVVRDGDTIVLGGVFRNEKTDSTAKTPVLGDLPVVGGLFRQTKKSDTKSELLIFITPKLIRDRLNNSKVR